MGAAEAELDHLGNFSLEPLASPPNAYIRLPRGSRILRDHRLLKIACL